jgi:hypothetical protein
MSMLKSVGYLLRYLFTFLLQESANRFNTNSESEEKDITFIFISSQLKCVNNFFFT